MNQSVKYEEYASRYDLGRFEEAHRNAYALKEIRSGWTSLLYRNICLGISGMSLHVLMKQA